MIKRTQLRQFMAVVDAGNFTRAAERLGVTQPTLSAGIAELERLADARLFVREKRRVRLTDAGNRLVAHARAIEREFRAAEASLAVSEKQGEPLRLGVLPSLDTAHLARLCRAYGSAPPLALVEGSDAELRRRLSEHRLDAALTLLRPDDAERGALALVEEDYALMLPAGHRLAERETVDPREVAGETMIARRSCEILGETSRYFTQRGVRPPFVLRSANDDRCMEMVRAGLGITTAPRSLQREGVVAVRLEGYDFRRAIGLLGEESAVRAMEAAWQSAVSA